MSLIKMIANSVVGALMFSSGVLGADGSVPGTSTSPPSSASCWVVATGYTDAKNQELTASASAKAAAYVCDGVGDPSAIAQETASAFAKAAAAVVAECVLKGDATAAVKASAKAKARAEIWVAAYFDAIASAATCGKCEAWANSWGFIEKWVFLEAIAEAEIKLNALSTAANLRGVLITMSSYETVIKGVVVAAFAQALTGAYNYKNAQGCAAWVNAGGCIWTVGHAEEQTYCVECAAEALSEGSVDAINAIAEAGISAATWTCGDSVAIVDVEVTAVALAEASAEALSLAWAGCSADEGGYVCSSAGTEISVWITAVVEAWAGVWADSYNCEDTCDVSIEAVVDAVGHILVDAATEAYAAICSGGGTWTKADFQEDLTERTLCAVAEAAVFAISTPDGCLAAGMVYAGAEDATCPDPHSSGV